MKNYQPQQGDIVTVDLDPTLGHEQQGYRPVLVVSQDILSKTSPFVWVVPISHGKYQHPTHVELDGRTKTDGTLFVEQLKSLDFHVRKLHFQEKVPSDILKDVLDNIRESLD